MEMEMVMIGMRGSTAVQSVSTGVHCIVQYSVHTYNFFSVQSAFITNSQPRITTLIMH